LYHGEVQVLVANFDTNGRMADHVEKQFRINFTEPQLKIAQEFGLSYSLSHAVKKAGPYQVRMAVVDLKSDRIGTASQFLIAPNVSGNRLSLGGILVGEPDAADHYPLSTPALRVFRRGHGMTWLAQVNNPRLKNDAPKLQTSLRLFRDGKMVSETPSAAAEIAGPLGKKPRDVLTRGTVELGRDWEPGDYILQLIVQDQNDGLKMVAQAVDFQVIP
jgi:hypothetical protein